MRYIERLKYNWKNIKSFPRKIVEYSPVVFDDRDFDYNYTLVLLRFKLVRLRDHILEHDIIMRAEEIGGDIDQAIKLLDRYMEDECEESWNEFFDLLKNNMRDWWD